MIGRRGRRRLRRSKRSELTLTGRRARDGSRRSIKFELLLVAVLLLAGLAFYLNRHPIRLGTAAVEPATGVAPLGTESGDLLLVLPDMVVPAQDFDDLDFAVGWSNLLSQEFGPHRVIHVSAMSPLAFGGVQLMIVPRSVARTLTAGQIAVVEEFVRGGGRAVVEMPTALWAPIFGVTADPSLFRDARRITAFDGALVRSQLRDDVIETPLITTTAPIQHLDLIDVPDVQVLLEVDGLPSLIRRALGRGEVFAIYFDLARAVAIMQQGSPTADWEVARPSVPLPSGYTRTASLVSDAHLRRNSVPYADLLEHQLVNVFTRSRPMPRVWRFPGSASGALIMTHDTSGSAQAGRFMLDWADNEGWAVSLFGQGHDAAALSDDLRQGAGLLLVPPEIDAALVERIGLLGIEPLERPVDLWEQVTNFTRGADDPDTLVTRLRDGLWSPDYMSSFGVLSALGVTMDSSYGAVFSPTDLEAVDGYSFGTGLPFRPIDRRGRAYDVFELPFVLHDGEVLEREWAERLVNRAGRLYHAAVVANWRTNTMNEAPRADVINTWRHLFEVADDLGMWITDLPTFARFWLSREQVLLSSEFAAGERRLTIFVETPPLPEDDGEVLLPGIAFEARYEDRPIERITRNGQDVPFMDLSRTGDGVLQIFPIPVGTSRIEVTYQGPIEIE